MVPNLWSLFFFWAQKKIFWGKLETIDIHSRKGRCFRGQGLFVSSIFQIIIFCVQHKNKNNRPLTNRGVLFYFWVDFPFKFSFKIVIILLTHTHTNSNYSMVALRSVDVCWGLLGQPYVKVKLTWDINPLLQLRLMGRFCKGLQCLKWQYEART